MEDAPTDYLSHYQYLNFFSNYSKPFPSPSNVGDAALSPIRQFLAAGRHFMREERERQEEEDLDGDLGLTVAAMVDGWTWWQARGRLG